MRDVQCGKFKPIKADPGSGLVTWCAVIHPPPTPHWRQAFDVAIAREHALGNVFSIVLAVTDSVITFDSVEAEAAPMARVVRRAVGEANEDRAPRPALGSSDGDATLARLRARYRDGI